jgi:hypothetical protein
MASRNIIAVEYRRLADLATTHAEASLLSQVRARHEVAAARWNELADLTERSEGVRPTPAVVAG